MSIPALAALLSGRLRGLDYPDRARLPRPYKQRPSGDLSGLRFGRLRVVERQEQAGPRRQRWICLCDCGDWTVVQATNLKRTRSCGCLARELLAARSRKET